ncbi:MAG: ATP-binding protein [Proteobacteria bacterium]|nr:ATP-binding protein [Pseudomonadota bacterium]
MLISVASGKGGTGKTTVATNLAYSLGSRAVILDCDVEEPNAHLFLHPDMDTTEQVWAQVPEVNQDACTLCRKCVDICRFRALVVAGKSLLVFPELCHSCGGCFEVCPENALNEGRRELGQIETGHSHGLECVTGCLRVGEAMSPPLIRKVRAHVRPDKINIIDAPPGTSCPVIAAMKGTDFVLMVTEPTPFGLHDLILAVEAVKVLGLPHGLVINRSDMGDEKVRDYAQKENIPILMEIPYDRAIAESYSKGKLIAEMWPEWTDIFQELFQKIQSCLA